ncbi:MAG: spore coat protein U domain-containing protein [Fusobacterium varium]|uniref:spore coat protein U domain-containing protein n=1 Tax=Fusobacterium varium TaxID=856 RepID=UPI003991F84C
MQLLLAGLLVVTGSTFAADIKTEASGNVDIYAQVLTNLEIDSKPLNFGVLGINDSKTIGANDGGAGSFTVTGATNTNISLTIEDTNVAEHKFENGQIIAKLVREGGVNSKNDFLEPQIYVYDNGTKITNTTFNIASKNRLHVAQSKEFKVAGDIKTKAEQNTGNYTGTIKVTAKYDSWPATTPAR